MWTSVLLTVILVAAAYIFVLIARYAIHVVFLRRSLSNIPGPISLSFIWGEEWNLYSGIPGSPYLQWHKHFGKVVRFSGFMGRPTLSITDPRAIAYIVGEGIYSFPKPHGVRAWFKATLGEGLVWVEGKQAHEKQRKSLAPALSNQAVRNLTSVFFDNAAKVATQWSKLIDQSNDSDEALIEITNWAGRYTLDTIAQAAFSYNLNSLSGEPHAVASALDELTNHENKLSSFYMRALFWIFPKILSLGSKGKMIRKSKQELGRIAIKMWEEAKIVGDGGERNIMSIMLKADEQGLKQEQVVDQMRTVISAGYETVSAVIAWTFYELAVNGELQARLREELAIGNHELLDAVFNEVLRLHPPILENHHEAAETITVPLSEPLPGTSDYQFVIPKGTILLIPLNVIQTDGEIWGQDGHLFLPERWLGQQVNGGAKRQIFAYSDGPRSCIGRSFSRSEWKALVITLLRQFSFTSPEEIESFQSFVVRPRVSGQGHSSLPLLVRKIEK
ncbi:cytochrome P450 [Mycena floridula]|nr:cytochrome P450 [Mycena floridula]